MARQGDLPRGDLTVLHATSATDRPVDLESVAVDLWKALRDGQGDEARAIIRSAYGSGVAVETLADKIAAPAMRKLGHDWETSRIDVWQEHRGTQLCAAALYDLKEDLEARAKKNRPVAVGGAPEGDPYLLPTLLAQYVLLDAGWEAVNLGPNTPLASLAKAVKELRPRLLWLSVSYMENREAFHRGLQGPVPSGRARWGGRGGRWAGAARIPPLGDSLHDLRRRPEPPGSLRTHASSQTEAAAKGQAEQALI